MTPEETSLKLLGRMFSEHARDTLERLESLEHLSNQHDLLLDTLLKNMEENTD